ncbi:MAG: DUF134 domain-containing protein [Dysgonamonadaceae bacterium]
MARIKKKRFVQMAPDFGGFKPFGVLREKKERILIHIEEYEALKLCDYEQLTQVEAAVLMNVSRPTFTRIYETVRAKIARAFIEGLPIVYEGGDSLIAEWYRCAACEILFTLTEGIEKECPLCGNRKITLNTFE